MTSTASPSARAPYARATGAALVTLLLLLLPALLSAQGLARLGLRASAGFDVEGKTVYGGQIDVRERTGAHTIEFAVVGVSPALRIDDYTNVRRGATYSYREAMEAWWIGLSANYLFWHAVGSWRPYLITGLGMGVAWTDWRKESPTDLLLGAPLPTGGSFDEERRLRPSSAVNLGVGWRMGGIFDVRAQLLTVLVPSTVKREDLRLMHALTLTTGLAF